MACLCSSEALSNVARLTPGSRGKHNNNNNNNNNEQTERTTLLGEFDVGELFAGIGVYDGVPCVLSRL